MKISKTISLLSLAFCLVTFLACNQSGETSTTGEASADEATEEVAEETTEEANPIVLVALHEVADYIAWKAVFDEHKPLREGAQIEDWVIDAGRDNPNLVAVISKVNDLDAAREFVQSEDLKQVMQEAGVQGEPQINFVEMVEFNDEAAQNTQHRLIINHQVEDYDAWKAVFDAKQNVATDAGVTLIGVARDLDDRNLVTVVGAAPDFETLEEFAGSEELKTAMEESGVIGEPQINYMIVVEVAPVDEVAVDEVAPES